MLAKLNQPESQNCGIKIFQQKRKFYFGVGGAWWNVQGHQKYRINWSFVAVPVKRGAADRSYRTTLTENKEICKSFSAPLITIFPDAAGLRRKMTTFWSQSTFRIQKEPVWPLT